MHAAAKDPAWQNQDLVQPNKKTNIKRKSTVGVGGGTYTLNRLQNIHALLSTPPERQVPILPPTCWINYSYVPNVKLSMQKYSKFMNKFMWHARSYEEFSMILSKNHRSKCKKTNHHHQHVAISVLKDGHLHPPWSGTPALGLQSNPGQPKLPPNPPASSPILQTIPLSQDRRGGS